MRLWANSTIKESQNECLKMIDKLKVYVPDEKLNADDIYTLQFILRHYECELQRILTDRERVKLLID